MLAVNDTNLRDNMKTYMDKVTDDYETIIVTRKNNKNVVMLSEEAYNNLKERIIRYTRALDFSNALVYHLFRK